MKNKPKYLLPFVRTVGLLLLVLVCSMSGMAAMAYFYRLPSAALVPADGGFLAGEEQSVPEEVSAPEEEVAVEPESEPVFSKLSGLELAEDLPEHLFFVMVENHNQARPQQAGVGAADLVYETLAEGGITRFMLGFAHGYPERVGPVRSARPYFVEWAQEFGSALAHAGGSPEGLTELASSDLLDLDEDAASMFRDVDYARPHNLFLNLADEVALQLAKNPDLPALTEPIFEYCTECTRTGGLPATELTLQFSSEASYDVTWVYSPDTQTYLREQNSVAHVDSADKQQIAATNLLVQFAPYVVVDDAGRLNMGMVGEGDAELYVGGKYFSGKWRKSSASSPTFFYDPDTEELWQLNPGKTWISVVESAAQVSRKKSSTGE